METIFTFSPLVVAIVPVILGLTEIAKRMGLPHKYAPAVSLVMGIVFVAITGQVWQACLVQGLIAGLAASGLWSGAKATVKPEDPEDLE
jgi:type IV secretory pathway VirB3-like protein